MFDEGGLHGIDPVHVLLERAVYLVDIAANAVPLGRETLNLFIAGVPFVAKLLELEKLDIQFEVEDILAQAAIRECFISLNLEALVGSLDLAQDALYLAHIFFSLGEFTLCLGAAHLEAGDAGGLLEEVAPLVGL